MNPNIRRSSWQEWPRGGSVRPLLSTRVERVAKKAIRRVKGSSPGTSPAQAVDLRDVYRLAASSSPTSRAEVLRRAFREAVEPEQAVDVSFAALALAIAAGDRPRTEGLIAFLELCYVEADLDAGASRMGSYVEECDAVPGSALTGLEYRAGWSALAGGARQIALLMPPLEPHSERRFDWELGPRRVVVRISGGLGNQLFQYAAALAYARRIGAPLRLDLANYEGRTVEREFLLGRLRVPVRRANSYEVLRTRLKPHREMRGVFDEFLFGDRGCPWLCGFWEDPAYFADIIPTTRRRFHPRDESLVAAADQLVKRSRISDGPVIGVHLRRGDRRPGGSAFSPFSTPPADYYRQAASRFPAGSNFLVFSDTPDDIAWARAHLGLGDGANVSFGEGQDPILDMFALSACDHLILSSGTFGWWAGYLGDRPRRRVIVPNGLQALSAERVVIPLSLPPQPGWEVITLAPGSLA